MIYILDEGDAICIDATDMAGELNGVLWVNSKTLKGKLIIMWRALKYYNRKCIGKVGYRCVAYLNSADILLFFYFLKKHNNWRILKELLSIFINKGEAEAIEYMRKNMTKLHSH